MTDFAEMGEQIEQVACATCDQLLTLPTLAVGELARCRRCGSVVATYLPHANTRALAFALAALCLLLCALWFPVLGMSVQGQLREITLLENATALIVNGGPLLGVFVLALIVVIPMILLLCVVALILGVRQGRGVGLLAAVGRFHHQLQHWKMFEVYVIGMLVSLTKIMSMADIMFGPAFFSLLGFAICFEISMHSVDRHALWRMLRNPEVLES